MSGVMRAPEAKKDDSGIVDLAAASQADPQAAVRAQSTPLASQGLFDEEPASIRPPMSAPAPMSGVASAHGLQQPAPSIPPMPASLPPASLAPQHSLTPSAPVVGYAPHEMASVHPLPAKKKGNGAVIALVFGGLVALSGAAAGGFFYMKSHKAAAPQPVAMNNPAPTVAAVEPTPAPAPAPVETAAAQPDPTPVAEEPKTTAKPGAKVAVAPKGGGAPVQAAPPAAKDPGPAKMTEKDLAAAPTGPAGDLGAAMKKEVGDKEVKPAAASNNTGATGNVPQKPSQGAVTGAIGAVLPQARGCLGPDDPISRASIVFGSDGSVQSVNISGAAAGKPAEACIKGALTKAKLAPFAEPSYTANITIRHN